jgi:hypothetical protein
MGVPPVSGMRMGVDRNDNGILDGDEPSPLLRITRQNDRVVIAWPTNAAGFVLERTSELSAGAWNPELGVRGVVADWFTVTNATASGGVFYRLREL